MKIQFTTSVAGANFAYRAKQIVDLRPDLAKGFVTAGQAVRVEDEPAPTPGEGLAGALGRVVRRVRRGGKAAELAAGVATEIRG